MSDLSQDELTALLIAAAGEPVIPIGRWKTPIESLLAKGLLRANKHPGDPTGHFNNVITEAGKAEAAWQDTIYDQQLGAAITQSNVIGHEQAKARKHAEQIAVQLVDLAEHASKITGDSKVDALRNWSKIILERALELLK